MNKHTAPKLIYNAITRTASGWKIGPDMDRPPAQPKCTHAGPCRFPFRQCDGGQGYSISRAETA